MVGDYSHLSILQYVQKKQPEQDDMNEVLYKAEVTRKLSEFDDRCKSTRNQLEQIEIEKMREETVALFFKALDQS